MADKDISNGGDDLAQETASKKSWREINPEEAMGLFNAYYVKQRASRRRITGDDVQEMLRERRAKRQQRKREHGKRLRIGKEPQYDTSKVVRLGLGGALLAGTIGTGALATSISESAQGQSQANAQEIALLEGEIRALENFSWGEEETAEREEQIVQDMEQARRKGDEVADLQSAYQQILADLNDQDLSKDNDTSLAFTSVAEHRKKLVGYFDQSARIIKDEDNYFPGADVPYGPSELDVLSPWYIRYANESRSKYAEASLNSWELASVNPRNKFSRSINVVWLNYESSSGELLAWARGVYDADMGVFRNLYVGQTTIGDRLIDRAETNDEGLS